MEYLIALLAAIAFWGIAHAGYQRKISMIWRRENGELRDRVRGLEERLKEADHEIRRVIENNREARRARRQYQGMGSRSVRNEFDDEPMEDAEDYLLVPDNLVNFFHRLFEKFREEDSLGDEKKETARRRKLNISAEDECIEDLGPEPEMEERDE